MGYSFGQVESAVLVMSPPKILPTISLLMRGNVGGTALMLWEHCPAVAETQVCYPHLSSCQCKAQHYEGCDGKRNSNSARTNIEVKEITERCKEYFRLNISSTAWELLQWNKYRHEKMASYLQCFLRDSGHSFRIKSIIVWQSCWRLTSPGSSGPRWVLYLQSACCIPLVQTVGRQLIPMGWVLECPKKQPIQCPQFTEQVTGVALPAIVSLLTRSLFNVIIMLSDSLSKVIEHLFSTRRHNHAN